MLVLRIVILCVVAFFWYAILRSLHARGGWWAEWPISSELTGQLSNLVDASFILIGVALALTPIAFGYGIRSGWEFVPDLLMFVTGAAAIGTMLSRRVWPNETIHITCAGITFGGAGIGLAIMSAVLHHYWITSIALASIIPAAITVLGNLKPLHEWLARFSRVEWATTVFITGALTLGSFVL